MRARNGSSLIEMIVLMTAISTILTLAVVVLHRTMRACSRAQATHADESSAWRLSSALRRDLAEGVEAKVEQKEEVIRLEIRTPVGGIISYRFEPLAASREQEREDGRRALEQYAFGGATNWIVAAQEDSRRVEVRTATDPTVRTLALAPVQMRVLSRLKGGSVVFGGSP